MVLPMDGTTFRVNERSTFMPLQRQRLCPFLLQVYTVSVIQSILMTSIPPRMSLLPLQSTIRTTPLVTDKWIAGNVTDFLHSPRLPLLRSRPSTFGLRPDLFSSFRFLFECVRVYVCTGLYLCSCPNPNPTARYALFSFLFHLPLCFCVSYLLSRVCFLCRCVCHFCSQRRSYTPFVRFAQIFFVSTAQGGWNLDLAPYSPLAFL